MNLKKYCPICVAVVGTWVVLLAMAWLGKPVDKILLATLMGMSAGALATKYGRNIIWKTLLVLLAVPAVWFAVKDQPGTAAVFMGLIILPTIYFNIKSKKGEQPENDLFRDCC